MSQQVSKGVGAVVRSSWAESGLRAAAKFKTFLQVFIASGLLLCGQAASQVSVTPITWDVVGLDHNRPLTSGPELFPVGARVCNEGSLATDDIQVSMIWEDLLDPPQTHPWINNRPGSRTVLDFEGLDPGDCVDGYFEIQLNRAAGAFFQSRPYRIEVSDPDENILGMSPRPRQIYIERLVSQNRNSTNLIRWGQDSPQTQADWVTLGPGGGLNLAVGETYFIELTT